MPRLMMTIKFSDQSVTMIGRKLIRRKVRWKTLRKTTSRMLILYRQSRTNNFVMSCDLALKENLPDNNSG